MKLWIAMIVLFLSVTGLCIWDGIHTTKTLNYMEEETSRIFNIISTYDSQKYIWYRIETRQGIHGYIGIEKEYHDEQALVIYYDYY